jgi:protein-S-isoprenylcysteine O-methyltransferase Ste14
MVDNARYVVAVLMMATLPPAIGSWFIIHPFVRLWRRLGKVATYSILYSLLAAAALILWEFRKPLLGTDLGFQPLLLVPAVPAAVVGVLVIRQRRRVLTEAIRNGYPEVSRTDKGRLLTEGIYTRMRNPRYIEMLLFGFVYMAFANYSGTWIMYALTYPAIHLVVLLEERELRDRFGAEYEEYCRRVPRYLPVRRGSLRLAP